MLHRLYYDPSKGSIFATRQKLQNPIRKPVRDGIKTWLLKQDAYTLHRGVRKRFPRNLYTINNINDEWESEQFDLQGLAKHNDVVKYLLSVIDVFPNSFISSHLKARLVKMSH
jgi:hypothetical protein